MCTGGIIQVADRDTARPLSEWWCGSPRRFDEETDGWRMDHTRQTVLSWLSGKTQVRSSLAFTVSRSDQGVHELSISRPLNLSPDVTLYSAE
jgi:hypothetical protein